MSATHRRVVWWVRAAALVSAALLPAHAGLLGSPAAIAASAPKVTASAPAASADGRRLTIQGRATAASRSAAVLLQRRVSGRWRSVSPVAKVTRRASGRFTLAWSAPPSVHGALTLRVVLVSRTGKILAKTTRSLKVTLARPGAAAPSLPVPGGSGATGPAATTPSSSGAPGTGPAGPAPESDPGGVPTAVITGTVNACALLDTGRVRCWGNNAFGQLANGAMSDTPVPVATRVTGLTDATALAAGSIHVCALRRGGTVACWGNNTFGQIGGGSSGDASAPVEVPGIAGATAIAAGTWFTCALRGNGTVACWGSNQFGQLGADPTVQGNSETPLTVPGIAGATAITARGEHACALGDAGQVTCWGWNDYQQLGNWSGSPAPAVVAGLGAATAISAGANHTCALVAGAVSCWGLNAGGVLGTLGISKTATPQPIPGIAGATAITAGARHACALRAGVVRCWGHNGLGELGDGTTDDSPAPTQVSDITDAMAIATSSEHTCALLSGAAVRCWGHNLYGHLGNGTTGGFSALPVAVVGL
jgi:alpha-tubulin suppressor-like RCC1 family protein